MKNSISIIIFVTSLFSIYEVAAQSKEYEETIRLKDGKVLEGVKTTDWLIVTTKDGKTKVYKKMEVTELKKDVDHKNKSISGKWSNYFGTMNWGSAMQKCISLGLRLPTVKELRRAYLEGVTDSWEKDGIYYWTSTPAEGDHSIIGVPAISWCFKLGSSNTVFIPFFSKFLYLS